MLEEKPDAVSQASSQFSDCSDESWDTDAPVVETESEPISKSVPNSEADETTGASPGTAQACSDLGLSSLSANLKRLGIKPPGQS